ncbi:SUN domain-containing protein 2 isoform X2 [Antechinus flavipes]|uniref:SUN domain-containing protein 2 isoform X2 n=1 Tax=Antechinus flavipes TaxID=38775 RepID=UPI0022362C3B|nr:SUN domain-containing protein 2 isoform X2 [Antechinus flavipes]
MMMSRRSQRLSHYYQVDDDGGSSSSSGGSSLTVGQPAAFKDSSPVRALKRKSSSVKHLSPVRLAGPAPSAQSTYYSESVVSETFIGRPRATPGAKTQSSILNDEQLDSDSYWSGDPLVRRRRGTGGTESSKINGLTEGKVTYDTYGSSSGYSSEDDFTGRAAMDQLSPVSALKNAAAQVGAFLWMVITFPGWLFGLLYWWIGTTWYRLTTAASLLDVFVLTRPFSSLKKLFLIVLMMLLLASLAYGAWYFYPYGLQTFHPAVFSWWAAKGGNRREEVWESGDSTPYFQAEQHVLSKIHTLERRLETLSSEYSTQWQKAILEHGELEKGAGGKGLSADNTLTILEGLVSRREAALKEDFRRDMAAHVQEELAMLRAEHRRDLDNLLKRVTQTSQEMESWVLQFKSEWQSLAQEALRENVLKEMGPLEAQLAGLKQELSGLSQKQAAVAQQVDLWPQKMEALRDDVKSHLPTWIRQFLLRNKEALAGLFQLEEVQVQLRELERRILGSVAEEQGRSAREAAANLKLTLRKEGMTGVTEEEVNQIVQQALKRYSEDRIGLVDYALESAGASILSTRCSETYDTKTAVLSLFGVPLWYLTQSPRAILQPDVYPGNCWAFQGPQGYAVIRLAARIRPTAVTLEHVSRTLSPSSDIPSAPREFAVLHDLSSSLRPAIPSLCFSFSAGTK